MSLDAYQEMLKKQVRNVWFTVYFIEDVRVASGAATNEASKKEDLESRANVEVSSFSVIQFVPDNKQGTISFHHPFYSQVTIRILYDNQNYHGRVKAKGLKSWIKSCTQELSRNCAVRICGTHFSNAANIRCELIAPRSSLFEKE